MKNKFKILYALFGLALLFTACTPTENELGTILDKSELKFTIVPDSKDPNMILLKSLTPNVTPSWVTPFGRSTSMIDTVKIAFPGTYKFVYGALCAGGTVEADTVTLNITTTNLSYVSDPLWTSLCGGPGNSKTWILDNGNYGFAAGPMSYADPSGTQEFENFKINWDPGSIGQTADDLSAQMTFDLVGGPHLTTVKPNETGVTLNGTYTLNVANHTLSTTDATIIRVAALIPNASNWTSNIKILELNANQLRLAIMRTNSDGAWWYVMNYVSKNYADNYVAQPITYGEPIKKAFTQKDLVGTWKYNLIGQNWISWEVSGSGKGGSQTNSWFTRADMIATLTSWGGSASTFYNADSNVYVFNADGTCTLNGIANTYTVSKGTITFGTPLTGTEWSLVYISLTGTTVNVLNVTSIGNKAYTSNGIWIGQRNGTKDEDQAVQLVKQY
jgi:hypothetical protein